ncbi:carbohydrate-binding module family 50 protein [Aspergillus carbonarius ITEM 5010]|uniref:Carbohydrate-binding module family 50 protein n=1 Tax=Aspergillus carbonarius (strain ITEM 5010) TaxID=602072 RepID=A0A1R3RPN4_ASPC5|nr:carbohydrate-binding module family 50 protein [Aspergillus carbonarius ITEM 5010]
MRGTLTALWATTYLVAGHAATNGNIPSRNCLSGHTYTTKQGDTCDSIALAHRVSAATMFYVNPNILNCSSILPDTPLCLPLECDVYTVQPGDTCTSIALSVYSQTRKILSYNSQLKWDCSNLHSPDPDWGSTICVSVPGGEHPGRALNASSRGVEAMDPPSGATVAPGTSMDCGAWFVREAGLDVSCAQICLAHEISISVFTALNPSIGRYTCDSDLVVGDAYCVKPVGGLG